MKTRRYLIPAIVLATGIVIIGCLAAFGQPIGTPGSKSPPPGLGRTAPPAVPMVSTAIVSTNNANNGIIGRPLPTTNTEVAWLDAKSNNPTVAGYNIYLGTSPTWIYKNPPIHITNWLHTNGWDYYNFTNIALGQAYSADMIALNSNGSPVYLANSPTNYVSTQISFMAEKSLLAQFDGTNFSVSFFCTSNHGYTLQSSNLAGKVWTNRQSFSNHQGVVTFTDPDHAGLGRFYRVAIQ